MTLMHLINKIIKITCKKFVSSNMECEITRQQTMITPDGIITLIISTNENVHEISLACLPYSRLIWKVQ